VVEVAAVVLGVVVNADAAPGTVAGLLTGTAAALPLPAFGVPEVGLVDVAGAVGSTVIGVGTGGSGFDITPAIISLRPASDLLRNL
jgi:hypothetical protein